MDNTTLDPSKKGMENDVTEVKKTDYITQIISPVIVSLAPGLLAYKTANAYLKGDKVVVLTAKLAALWAAVTVSFTLFVIYRVGQKLLEKHLLLGAKNSNLNDENKKLTEQVETLNREKAVAGQTLQTTKQDLETKLTQLQGNLQKAQGEVTKLKNAHTEMTQSLKGAEVIIGEQKQGITVRTIQIEQYQQSIQELKKKIIDLEAELEVQKFDPLEKETFKALNQSCLGDNDGFLDLVLVSGGADGEWLTASQLFPTQNALSQSQLGQSPLSQSRMGQPLCQSALQLDVAPTSDAVTSWWLGFKEIVSTGGTGVLAAAVKQAKGGAMTVANAAIGLTGAALAGCTTNAPLFKQLQISAMITNMFFQVSNDLDLELIDGFSDPWKFLSKEMISRMVGHEQTQWYKPICELLAMPLEGLLKYGYTTDAAKQRYEFLMKLEGVFKAIDYEKQIDAYLKCTDQERWKTYPQIKILHLLAKHLSETPIWDQATDELNQHLHHKNGEGLSYKDLPNRLKKDVGVILLAEKENKMKMDRTGVNCNKLAMQNGNGEATNYMYNYMSKLGHLVIDGRNVTWNRMGSPSLDVGGVHEPAQLTALYTLLIDGYVSEGKSAGFIGLQKSPDVSESGAFSGFEAGDFEKNRTAAFIQANQKPRWQNHFHFVNLSLDQITENPVLKLKRVESLEEKGESEDMVAMSIFAAQLKSIMIQNKNGFYGLDKKLVERAVNKVQTAFFTVSQDLSDKQRWSFYILTCAMVVFELIKEKKLDMFHINCKDGIDRAAVINLVVMMISQFADQTNPDLDLSQRVKNIQDLITMFMHAAYFVKGQTPIASRAPLAYWVAEQMFLAATQEQTRDGRLEMLGGYACAKFAPFTGILNKKARWTY